MCDRRTSSNLFVLFRFAFQNVEWSNFIAIISIICHSDIFSGIGLYLLYGMFLSSHREIIRSDCTILTCEAAKFFTYRTFWTVIQTDVDALLIKYMILYGIATNTSRVRNFCWHNIHCVKLPLTNSDWLTLSPDSDAVFVIELERSNKIN